MHRGTDKQYCIIVDTKSFPEFFNPETAIIFPIFILLLRCNQIPYLDIVFYSTL